MWTGNRNIPPITLGRSIHLLWLWDTILSLGQKVFLWVLLEKLNANLSESTLIGWQGTGEKGVWRRVKKRNQGWSDHGFFNRKSFTVIVKRERAREKWIIISMRRGQGWSARQAKPRLVVAVFWHHYPCSCLRSLHSDCWGVSSYSINVFCHVHFQKDIISHPNCNIPTFKGSQCG